MHPNHRIETSPPLRGGSAEERRSPRRWPHRRPGDRGGLTSGFRGRGAVVAVLIALALSSYGWLVLSPQRIDLPTPDSFVLPTAVAPEPGAASASRPAGSHT